VEARQEGCYDCWTLLALDLDGRVGDQVQAIALDLFYLGDFSVHTDARSDFHRVRKANFVEAVVHLGGDSGDIEQLRPERDDQREGQKTVCDRGAKWAFFRTLNVSVDPLVIAGRISEGEIGRASSREWEEDAGDEGAD